MIDKLVIEPGRTERQYWRDLWRYPELFYFLAWRDILVRYKQTAVGIAWAVLRPCLTTLVVQQNRQPAVRKRTVSHPRVWSLLRAESLFPTTSLITALLCGSGPWYFRRTERTFADVSEA